MATDPEQERINKQVQSVIAAQEAIIAAREAAMLPTFAATANRDRSGVKARAKDAKTTDQQVTYQSILERAIANTNRMTSPTPTGVQNSVLRGDLHQAAEELRRGMSLSSGVPALTPEQAVEGFRNIIGAKRERLPALTLDESLETIANLIAAADDPFAEGGKWLTRITTMITEAIKEAERE